MKKLILSLLIPFIGFGAFAQERRIPPGKEFPIHRERRELRHELRGKRHDFRKFHNRRKEVRGMRAIRRHRFGK